MAVVVPLAVVVVHCFGVVTSLDKTRRTQITRRWCGDATVRCDGANDVAITSQTQKATPKLCKYAHVTHGEHRTQRLGGGRPPPNKRRPTDITLHLCLHSLHQCLVLHSLHQCLHSLHRCLRARGYTQQTTGRPARALPASSCVPPLSLYASVTSHRDGDLWCHAWSQHQLATRDGDLLVSRAVSASANHSGVAVDDAS